MVFNVLIKNENPNICGTAVKGLKCKALITISIVFNLFYLMIKSLVFSIKLKNMGDFHPLAVVGRSSETQLQLGEN